MKKSILAAGVSLIALAAITTANAGTVGHISGGVGYSDWSDDVFGGSDVDMWQFNFQGAVAFDLTPTWNVQFDTSFRSDRLSEDTFGGKTVALNTWTAGTQLFWRDATKGLFGAQVSYQSLDAFSAFDGVLIGLRGEYFVSDVITLGGNVTYSNIDYFGDSADTWGGSLHGTYYTSDKMALSLRGTYSTTDFPGSSDNVDVWGVGADIEYLFQNNLSLGGSVGWNTADSNGFDADGFVISTKLKVYFGTEGTLSNQHRTSTLEPLGSGSLSVFGL